MIVITGASRGLGKKIFDTLKSKGMDCIGIARTTNQDDIIECDISDFDSLKIVSNKIKKICNNKIYALINVAGIASMNLALTTPEKKTREIIETNLLGTIFTNQIFAPMLIRNKSGRIINFSSLSVRLGIKGESVYTASKAGVESFSRTFAREMADFNVRVNCIAPGPIQTDLLKGITDTQIKKITSQQVIPKQFQKSDVCDLIELLIDERARSLSGQVLNIGGV